MRILVVDDGEAILKLISLILRRNIDPDGLFADYGLDSLGNLELRTHIETGTGIRINPRAIVTHNPRPGCKRKARNRYSWLSG